MELLEKFSIDGPLFSVFQAQPYKVIDFNLNKAFNLIVYVHLNFFIFLL